MSTAAIQKLIDDNQKILIIQADNPDGDSLASALALEQILGDMDKQPSLYCGVDIPTYLRYLSGWDRVDNQLPKDFDTSIVVDASAQVLLERLSNDPNKSLLKQKPCLVIDHHSSPPTIDFADIKHIKPAVATGELIYDLSQKFKWPLNLAAKEFLAVSIMSDSLGLVSEGTTAHSIKVIAELVEGGVSLAKLEDARRNMMRKSPELLAYKGRLLQRIEFYDNNRIVTITIPWSEIEKYSPLYNPTMLVLDEMRFGENTDVAIGFKTYRDGRITAKIKTNYGKAIADKLAEHFGGGGHPYASGFKVTDGRTINEIKKECIALASALLDNLDKDHATT
ncbi:MAG TPA: DHH family phosphoesterase [Candidatus Saccharimonadales bacterium]|nr:DHH family phosphoesterase [Candidatus Saccharimonadales bacterium]